VAGEIAQVDAAARAWSHLGQDLAPTRVRVVGRVGWVRANLRALHGAFDPLAAKLSSNRAVASRAVGLQIGLLLGLLSTKVLGQYVLPLGGPGLGQLVVVGPNLLELEDRFGPLAGDLRRSVLLHEVTHRLQFDGVPWLGQHLRDLLTRYLGNARLDGSAIKEIAGRLPGALARARVESSITPIVEAVLTPDQVDVVRDAQGLMSLLEGHGNAAMFRGAEGVVGDSAAVRGALEQRRSDVTTRILAVVAGMEMKQRQYREGEAFVAAVVDRVGTSGLNQAFVTADNLPRADEVNDPAAWLERVGLTPSS
jgi:coenzyme F420 biosynthesis associated uncharacterized protein